ncbi:MAG: hypothetical protein ACI9XO_000397 [Paraglaciecola sp.]|jgi:hypothetical protein
MNSLIYKNGLRFLGLVLIQGLILRNIGVGWESFPYFNVLIYPLFILLLPMRTPTPLVIFLGFCIGISIDMFYNSLGVHAAAMTFSAFVRPLILKQLEPRGGYNTNYSPTAMRYGSTWFAWYAGVFMLLHCFTYFFVEAFTPYYMIDIWLKTIFSFVLSYFLIFLIHTLFNNAE